MPRAWTYTPDQKQAMVDEYKAGASLNVIGARYGCEAQNVRHILRRRGVVLRARGRGPRSFSAAEVAQIVAAWDAGDSQTKIAQALGSSQATIGRVLRDRGLVAETRQAKREKHGSWRGGRTVSTRGYVFVRVEDADPHVGMRGTTGYAAEHRLVMARVLGRDLYPSETVHHVNGDKMDNRLENLQLRSGSHGTGAVFRCNDCGSHDVQASQIDG